jgi:hypothetical protein
VQIAGRALDDNELEFTIYQGDFFRKVAEQSTGRPIEPLTVRAIIRQIAKWCTTGTLNKAERAFLVAFGAAKDKSALIEGGFFDVAMEVGSTLRSHSIRDANRESIGWCGLHRLFGMYVVNATQYGEGQDEFGPFAKKKDAKAVFDAAVADQTVIAA